ncbi:MAG: histidine kinase dimerization/phospho-acceptor domain-containing protein [Candidatus Hodarchaeales archaeon]|jgi:K+-sensing histidine kinase KdpD
MVIIKEVNQFKRLIGEETPSLSTIIDHFSQRGQNESQEENGIKLLQMYLSMINHELRTPITCIQTAAEIMNQNNSLSEEEKKVIYQLIVRNIQRLIQSIENLFNM